MFKSHRIFSTKHFQSSFKYVLTQSNTLKNVTEINNYREQNSTPYILPDVISINNAFQNKI